jgi:hypothetical protein
MNFQKALKNLKRTQVTGHKALKKITRGKFDEET